MSHNSAKLQAAAISTPRRPITTRLAESLGLPCLTLAPLALQIRPPQQQPPHTTHSIAFSKSQTPALGIAAIPIRKTTSMSREDPRQLEKTPNVARKNMTLWAV